MTKLDLISVMDVKETNLTSGTNMPAASNILDIHSIRYSVGDDFNAFYLKFRTGISDKLRKKGDTINEDIILLEDEILSPTFEDVIVLWCLEKIHPQLPDAIQKYFGYQLSSGTSLKYLQEDIFKVLPMVIEGIDSVVGDYDAEVKMEEEFLDGESLMDPNKVDNHFNFKVEDTKLDPIAIKSEKRFEESDLGQDFIDDDVVIDDFNEIPNNRKRRKRVKGGTPGKKNYEYPPMKLKCPNCEKMIKIRYLKVHFQKVHKMSKEESCKEAHIVRTVQKVQCSMCDSQVWARNMKSHFRTDHNIELSKLKAEVTEGETVKKWLINASCELCGKVLRKCHLKEHMEFVHKITEGDISSKMAECPICSKEMRKKNLKQHIAAMHEGERVEEAILPTRKKQSKESANIVEICPICGKEVKRKSMKQHMINKHEQQIIKEDINDEEKTMCTICGMMYTKKCIERHTARCLKKEAADKPNKFRVDKNLFCETCKRHFMNQEHMNDHKCAHLKCDQCDAEFIRLRNLENHKRGHAGEKLFPCELCEGLFMSRKRCLEHRKYSHNPDYRQQKHQCTQCDAKFTLKTNLNKHIINVHNTTVRQFECLECGKSYKRKDALKVHMHYIHTKDGFCKTCPDCGKKILSHGEFKLHREMFKCKALKAKAKAEKETITVMEVQPTVVTTVETIVQFPIKLDQM